MNKKRKEELLQEINEQIERSCMDRQVVTFFGPKDGKTVKVVRRYHCLREKGHEGDHMDHAQYVGWPQGTESPSTIVVNSKHELADEIKGEVKASWMNFRPSQVTTS